MAAETWLWFRGCEEVLKREKEEPSKVTEGGARERYKDRWEARRGDAEEWARVEVSDKGTMQGVYVMQEQEEGSKENKTVECR